MVPLPDVLTGVSPDSLANVCRRFNVRRLDLFGSATNETFDPERSDLDFLVTFDALDGSNYADIYFGLRDTLKVLFGRELDLMTDQALKNPYLRRQVDWQRRQLFPSV